MEKWAAAVYGIRLSTEAFGTTEAVSTAFGEREKRGPQHLVGTSETMMREVRVSLKCKGAKRRVDKQPLIAHVDKTWSPRHDHLKSAKKRSSGKTEAEKPAKRGKLPTPKPTQPIVVGTSSAISTPEERSEDGALVKKSNGVPDVPGASDQAWAWLGDCTSLPPGQPPAEDEPPGADDHVGRSSFSSRAEDTVTKTAAGPGALLGRRCVWHEISWPDLCVHATCAVPSLMITQEDGLLMNYIWYLFSCCRNSVRPLGG